MQGCPAHDEWDLILLHKGKILRIIYIPAHVASLRMISIFPHFSYQRHELTGFLSLSFVLVLFLSPSISSFLSALHTAVVLPSLDPQSQRDISGGPSDKPPPSLPALLSSSQWR